jgi:type IV fimbrial biogenesis protein FimT
MPNRRISGFTLVELAVAMAVLAILVAVAFPNFLETLRSNRVATTSNELIASLSLARSEAVRGTRGAGLCSSSDGQACGGEWNDGWIVWQDVNGNGAFDAGTDRVVKVAQAHPSLAISNGAEGIVFDPRGRPQDGAQAFNVKPQEYDSPSRNVCMGATGQARVSHEDCP